MPSSNNEVTLALITFALTSLVPLQAQAVESYSAAPRMSTLAPSAVPDQPMEPKNVPDYAPDTSSAKTLHSSTGTSLQAGLESTTLPVETRLRLIIESPLDARTSLPGEIFEAHVGDDLFIGRSLLLPRGSLVRGRVIVVSKPRLISRAGRIGLKLDQIVTPTGEVIPLDASLEFQKGMTNKTGQLDPGTNFGTRVESNVRNVTGLNSSGGTRGALVAANIATLGAPAVATLIGGSAVALFRSGDNVSLQPGQEIEILLTNDLGLQIN